MYTLENIPAKHKAIIKNALLKIPTYTKLMRQAERELKHGHTKRLEQLNLQMFDLENRVYLSYLKSIPKQKVTMAELMETMPVSDVAELNISLHTIAFCVDIIETNVMAMNERLKPYHDSCEIVQFDKIIELGKSATAMRRYITGLGNDNPGEEELYADTMDSVEAQLKRRVQTYLKRMLLIKEKNNKKK